MASRLLPKRASFQLPRDVMGIKLITDWPKLLIFWSSVFSFQKSLLVCRFGIPAHFKAKGQPGDLDLNPLCY